MQIYSKLFNKIFVQSIHCHYLPFFFYFCYDKKTKTKKQTLDLLTFNYMTHAFIHQMEKEVIITLTEYFIENKAN